MNKYILSLILLILFIGLTESCSKDQSSPDTDAALFALTNESGYSYYIGTPGITAGAGNSPHGFERVRFNAIAKNALTANGKLPVGATFPAGSVIVKEIYSSASGTVNLLAVMKKDASSDVSANGYQWGEYKPDGKVEYSTGKKGSGCISCHAGGNNRDLVRIFDLR